MWVIEGVCHEIKVLKNDRGWVLKKWKNEMWVMLSFLSLPLSFVMNNAHVLTACNSAWKRIVDVIFCAFSFLAIGQHWIFGWCDIALFLTFDVCFCCCVASLPQCFCIHIRKGRTNVLLFSHWQVWRLKFWQSWEILLQNVRTISLTRKDSLFSHEKNWFCISPLHHSALWKMASKVRVPKTSMIRELKKLEGDEMKELLNDDVESNFSFVMSLQAILLPPTFLKTQLQIVIHQKI